MGIEKSGLYEKEFDYIAFFLYYANICLHTKKQTFVIIHSP